MEVHVKAHIDIVPDRWYTVYGTQDSVFSRYLLLTTFMERAAPMSGQKTGSVGRATIKCFTQNGINYMMPVFGIMKTHDQDV